MEPAKVETVASKVRLGDTVKDRITGLTGVAICRMEWLHGCLRWLVQPKELKDGKPVEASAFDDPQLEVVWTAGGATPPQPGGVPTNEAAAVKRM